MSKKRYVASIGEYVFDFIVLLIMIFITVITLYPFLYILFYSLTDPSQFTGGLLFYPKGFNLSSYMTLLDSKMRVPQALLVSILRSTIGPLLSLFVTSMGAYVLTRQDLIGRKFFVRFITITMYFSSGLIPMYILMQKIHISGTFWVYILPGLFSTYNMILIRTYMEGLPQALTESALIDGANDYVLFFKIVLPLSMPVLAAVVLFMCVNQWNAYSDTMIYNASKRSLHTLQYVLMTYISSTSVKTVEDAVAQAQSRPITTTSLKMALTIVTVIPILCVYPFLQKYFAKGILIGSVKG